MYIYNRVYYPKEKEMLDQCASERRGYLMLDGGGTLLAYGLAPAYEPMKLKAWKCAAFRCVRGHFPLDGVRVPSRPVMHVRQVWKTGHDRARGYARG